MSGGEQRTSLEGSGPTYYDQPAIKEPVWIWSVPAYLYTGGVASGTALLAVAAQVVDRDGHDALVRRCRDVSLASAVLSTGFLIHDLGRPARFLNMLRVFRPSSAMSVGSWILAAFSAGSAAAAVLPRLGLRRLGDVGGLGAGMLAPALGTYTAVLLADTAVPVWQSTRRELPALFGASGLASSAALVELLGPDDERSQAIAHRLGIVAKAAELVAAQAVLRRADEIESVGRPLHQGASAAMWRAAGATTAASLALTLLPGRNGRRWRRRLAGLLGSVGAITIRFAIFQAGKASARDPRATFDQQRSTVTAD